MSDLTRTVGPNEAKHSIKHAITKNRPIFLWGPPGVGKSEIVEQIGVDLGAHVIDVRLSLWEPTDIKGIPYFDSNVGKMVWAPPAELPDNAIASQHKKIILFLDEMNSAAPAVQAAAYQLILNRRVGQYVVPDNVYIIAAGNREADKGVTYRMPAPLTNRFVHLEVAVKFDDWFDWAVSNRIHKDVVGYLQFAKQDLYQFDPRSPSRSFATPRSWTFVSQLLDDTIPDNIITNLVSGAVGEGVATKFVAHRKISSTLPNPSDILSGKTTTMKTKEMSAMYSLAISLCYELKEAADEGNSNFNSMTNNFLTFIMDNFETEMTVMAAKLAVSKYDLPIDPDEVECFGRFIQKYGKYVKAAHGV
jgi:MoxR-like ATPase